jgi:hypothetical protein
MDLRRCIARVGFCLLLASLAPLAAADQAPAAAAPASAISPIQTTGTLPESPTFALACTAEAPLLSKAPASSALDLPEVQPWASKVPLCTHPTCPPGQIYDCICMECHGRCPSGYFWDDSLCACAPI